MKRALEEIGFDLEEVLNLDRNADTFPFFDSPSRTYAPFNTKNYMEISTKNIKLAQLGGEAHEKVDSD